MYRKLALAMTLAAVVFSGTLFAATHEVMIMNSAFTPSDMTVQQGDSIVWTNMDTAPHTVTATDNSFDSGMMLTNDTYTHVFDAAGNFAYVCLYHSDMTAVVRVQSASSGTTHFVSISASSFVPQQLDIQPGDSVVWNNDDSIPHTVTATDNSFDSGFMAAGAVWGHRFEAAGSYPYVCLYHSDMTGVVNAGTQGGGDTTWVEQQSPTTLPLKDVRFWNESVGWIAGDQGVLRTTDGGENWTLVPTSDDCEAVFFINEMEGWVCGNDGMILHSTNGGASWTPQNSGVGEKIRDIWFADEDNGWAGGRDGLLIHTTDGGLNWNPQNSPAQDDIRGFHMLDNQRGWMVASDGLILYTSNGGTDWETQLSVPGGEEDEFEAVFALDENLVWAAGGQGRIYRTEDGGENWTQQTSGTTVALMDIQFTDPDHGWVCGAGGFLSKAMNQGTMWHTQTPPSFSTLNSIYFVNGTVGYLVTEDGRIFKKPDLIDSVQPRENAGIVSAVSLSANYPNPFNPTTTIEFSVPESGPVTLQVFDILGRDVATLVNQTLTAGSYTARFSAQDQPSGAYFYRINSAGQSVTRIMTLMK